MSTPRCFQVHAADNVATLLDDAEGGPIVVLGATAAGDGTFELLEPIRLGHKVALRDLAAGDPVVKFGVTIGRATTPVRRGQWVHLHNCASTFDERSQTLDLHSGAATDTTYE